VQQQQQLVARGREGGRETQKMHLKNAFVIDSYLREEEGEGCDEAWRRRRREDRRKRGGQRHSCNFVIPWPFRLRNKVCLDQIFFAKYKFWYCAGLTARAAVTLIARMTA
jgi:hypothetical protein